MPNRDDHDRKNEGGGEYSHPVRSHTAVHLQFLTNAGKEEQPAESDKSPKGPRQQLDHALE